MNELEYMRVKFVIYSLFKKINFVVKKEWSRNRISKAEKEPVLKQCYCASESVAFWRALIYASADLGKSHNPAL